MVAAVDQFDRIVIHSCMFFAVEASLVFAL